MGKKAWCNTSFSYSSDDIPILEEVYRIAKDDCVSFSQVVMQQLKQLVHDRKPATMKYQIRMDSFVENPNFISMPALLDHYDKWKKHIEHSDLDHIEKCERATLALTVLFKETWKKKSLEMLYQKISKDAAVFKDEGR